MILKQQANRIYNQVEGRDPTFYDNPPMVPWMFLNTVSGELFTCLDNSINRNWWIGTTGRYVEPYYESISATFSGADYTDLDTGYVPEIGYLNPFDFDGGYQYLTPSYDAFLYQNKLVFVNPANSGFYFNNLKFYDAPRTIKFDVQFTREGQRYGNAYFWVYGGASIHLEGDGAGNTAKFAVPGEEQVILPLTFTWNWYNTSYIFRVTYDGEDYKFYIDGVLQQTFYRPGVIHEDSHLGIRMGADDDAPTDTDLCKLSNVSMYVGGLRP